MAACWCVSETRQSSPDTSQQQRRPNVVPFNSSGSEGTLTVRSRTNSPVVSPTFKISRGTQMNHGSVGASSSLGAVSTTSPRSFFTGVSSAGVSATPPRTFFTGSNASVAAKPSFTSVACGPPHFTSRSPPLPLKFNNPQKSPNAAPVTPVAPPVPPKPNLVKSNSPVRPSIGPKPALPPKPSVKCSSSSISIASRVDTDDDAVLVSTGAPAKKFVQCRPPRSPSSSSCTTDPFSSQASRMNIAPPVTTAATILPTVPVIVRSSSSMAAGKGVVSNEARKSASLGRFESLQRNLQKRDSGFVSCEFFDHASAVAGGKVPVAPPRRRRKSVDSYKDILNEPIYAVVDFSKKINRRSLIIEAGSTNQVVVMLPEEAEQGRTAPLADSVAAVVQQPEQASQNGLNSTPDSTLALEAARSASKTSLASQLEAIGEVNSSSSEKLVTSEENETSDLDISVIHSPDKSAWCYGATAPLQVSVATATAQAAGALEAIAEVSAAVEVTAEATRAVEVIEEAPGVVQATLEACEVAQVPQEVIATVASAPVIFEDRATGTVAVGSTDEACECESLPDSGTSAAVNETAEPSSCQPDLDDDIQLIENSFAAITMIIQSFSNHSISESPKAKAAPTVERKDKPSAPEPVELAECQDTTTITRLVVGGSVVQQTDNARQDKTSVEAEPVVSGDDSCKDKMNMKEFRTVLEDVLKHKSAAGSKTPQRQNALRIKRRSSPALSTSSLSSSGSCDSKEYSDVPVVPNPRICYDTDDLSTGTLGDVDTSDAARQSSLDDDVDSTTGTEGRSNPSGLRRTLDVIFRSFSKTTPRKSNNERRKSSSHRDSSSTDTDNHQQAAFAKSASSITVVKKNKQISWSTDVVHKSRSISLDETQKYASVVAEFSALNGATVCKDADLTADSKSPSAVCTIADIEEDSDLKEHCGAETSLASNNSLLEESYEVETGAGVASASADASVASLSRRNSDSENDFDLFCSALDGRAKKAYLTAREICSSERVFVDCLRLICQDFRVAVQAEADPNAKGTQAIPDVELNKILSYLPQLLNLNEELLGDFELRVRNWCSEPRIADVIVRKGPFLKLFSAYIRDFQAQCALLDECVLKYPRFGKILKQFEMSERCQKLSLKQYMLKPVQRLPQYRLLLDVYLRSLDETCVDYSSAIKALKVVTEVADHANESMKHEDSFQRLLQLQTRLGNCEIIKPGRQIIKEGELNKVCRKTLQPRYFVLLNDCLLYTSYVGSPSASCNLKLNHELPLSRMEVHLPCTVARDFDNEFNVISTTRSFTLVSSSAQARDEWISAMTQAISEFQSKLSSFSTTKAPTATDSEFNRIGQQAPVWIPDSRVTMCQLCTADFTVTFRRHHCRACGKVICGSCSSNKAQLEYLKFRTARVCDACFAELTGFVQDEENESSTCSSLALENASSGEVINVASPFALVNALGSNYKERRPSSDPLAQPAAQAGLRAQFRRQHVRKEGRYIPQRLKEVSANYAGSQMSGYLSRRGRKSWKRNWFVLMDRVLYIYKAPEDVVALDTIPVLGYSVQGPCKDLEESDLVFRLCHPKQAPIEFLVDNSALSKKWIEALSTATVL